MWLTEAFGYEQAALLNTLVPGCAEQGAPRDEDLAQGEMQVADLSCQTCGSELGWIFLADHHEKGHNAHLVRRCGLLVGAFLDASLALGENVEWRRRQLQLMVT